MAQAKVQATFSGSHNSGFQMGQNMGTVNTGTVNTFAEGVTVYMGGSSAQSPEEQFLDALIAGDTSIGVPIEPAEPGTCSWVLTELRSWRKEPHSHPLWISGSSGCGKSVMSWFILREKNEWISPQEETKGKTIVAGSFCDRHPSRQKPIWILRTLLYEILKQNRDLIDTKDPEFWQESGNKGQPILNLDLFESIDSLAKLLGQITDHANVSEVYLVVDGQYQQQEDAMDLEYLVNRVSSYCGKKATPRWIFSTRPNDLNRLMPNTQVIDLFERNRQDILVVAQARMKHLQRLNSAITESFISEVVEIMTTRAEGMFLWLSLALKSLGNSTIWDINEIKEKLQSIPYNVQAIYGTIYEHLDKRMKTLLLWVHVAGRSLKLSEVLVMWALQDGEESIEAIEKKSLSPDAVRNSFESNLKALLVLHDDSTIHFAHPSVNDFTQQLFNSTDGQEQISIANTHKQLAELCLAYLSLEEIRTLVVPEPPVDENGMIDRVKREEEIKQYLGRYQFLEYSIIFLDLHLRESEEANNDAQVVEGRDEFFGRESQAMKHWVRGYDLLVRCTADTGGSNSLSLLFISARLNLTSLAEQFISTGGALTSLINLPGMKLLAAGASSFDMVRSQLVDLPDIKGWRALHIAADSEAEKVVEWLLNNGAAVDSNTIGFIRPGRTALHFAASKSSNASLRIVQALLKKGANPGEPTIFGGNTPLHYAVQGGSVEILRALLTHKKPAQPNYPNFSGITALHKAVAIPNGEAMVEVLLQHKADPEETSSLDKVAVVRGVKDASVVSTIKAVTIMKPASMWKSVTDTFHGVATNKTALHIAVGVKGTEETVKKLLKWYADNGKMAKSKDSMGYTALHSAVDGDSCFTHVKLLVDSKRIDINVQDEIGRTALVLYMQRLSQAQSLSEVGDLSALKKTLDDLLDSGIVADTRDQAGKSAVDYAKQAGLTWAIEKLNSVLKHPEILTPSSSSEPKPPSESAQGVKGMLKKTGLGRFSKKF
ncbi:ANK_REP_REGION domain-containing protein [Trichoderma simmonsii]|uniref:ANK_REP_REGION domain-containing protein n=1 Tax=Trichoderma simmonsii TaxID=1491479 RepID=A0A8G0L6J3_9HYPO|nr:ANK_REP_REGION domain-containing protein [Trichoderma simmonsii]